MTGLSPTRWPPIARRLRYGAVDGWVFGRNFFEQEIRRAHDAGEIVVMHKGNTLVARIAEPNWKRLRRRFDGGRV